MKKDNMNIKNNVEEELNYERLTKSNYVINSPVKMDNAIPILQAHYDIEKEIPSIVRDDVFKLIMLNERRKEFPCKFLSILLDMDYEDLLYNLKFRKNELDRNNIKSKKRTVDFAGKYENTIFSIEMNNTNTLERNIDYANMLAEEKNERGSNKYRLYCVIQINLNNFKFEGHDDVFEIYKTQDRKGNQYFLQSFVNVSLLNLRNKFYNNGVGSLTRKEKFILAITETNRSQIKKLIEGDEEIMKLFNAMKRIITSNEVLRAYDHQAEDIEAFKLQQYANGEASGLKKGLEQGQSTIILNMFNMGQNVNSIHELTGVSKDKIKSILNII